MNSGKNTRKKTTAAVVYPPEETSRIQAQKTLGREAHKELEKILNTRVLDATYIATKVATAEALKKQPT